MKAKKIIAIGVAAIAILEIVFSRFIRLLKGEQMMDLLARIGGLNDISPMSLVKVAFVALFSFLRGARLQPCIGAGIPPLAL